MTTLHVREGNQITEALSFTMIICCNCGIPFMAPEMFRKEWKSEGKTFYCPNGHSMVYRKSTADELREKMEREQQESKSEIERLTNNLLDVISEKNKLQKQVKRIHAGVCPCCNRTFTNIHRHMKTKHPELSAMAKRK